VVGAGQRRQKDNETMTHHQAKQAARARQPQTGQPNAPALSETAKLTCTGCGRIIDPGERYIAVTFGPSQWDPMYAAAEGAHYAHERLVMCENCRTRETAAHTNGDDIAASLHIAMCELGDYLRFINGTADDNAALGLTTQPEAYAAAAAAHRATSRAVMKGLRVT